MRRRDGGYTHGWDEQGRVGAEGRTAEKAGCRKVMSKAAQGERQRRKDLLSDIVQKHRLGGLYAQRGQRMLVEFRVWFSAFERARFVSRMNISKARFLAVAERCFD